LTLVLLDTRYLDYIRIGQRAVSFTNWNGNPTSDEIFVFFAL
jgi:hypothetical protein